MHKSRLIVRLLIRSWSEKKPNRTNKGAIGRGKVTKIVVLPSCSGSKKWYFDAKWCGSIFKNVLPTEGVEHFFIK